MKFKIAFRRGKKLKFFSKLYHGIINIEPGVISIIYNRQVLLIHDFNSVSIVRGLDGKYILLEGNNENLYLFPYTISIFIFYFTNKKHYNFFYSFLDAYLENKKVNKIVT